MGCRSLWFRLLLPAVLLCSAGLSAHAQQQEDKDSIVVLISAKSAQVVLRDGNSFRKVIGPARFFHNNTYLLCDTPSGTWTATISMP